MKDFITNGVDENYAFFDSKTDYIWYFQPNSWQAEALVELSETVQGNMKH